MKNAKNSMMETSEIAKQIYKKSSEYKFSLTPQNYTIWHAYFAQSDQNMRDEIDKEVSLKKSFTDDTSRALYEKYFKEKNYSKPSPEIDLKTKELIQDVIDDICDTVDITSGYKVKLKKYSRKLRKVENTDHIRMIVEDIIKDSNDLENSYRKVQGKLDLYKTEAVELKQRLEKVEKDALVDSLTSLFNRRAFDEKLKKFYDDFINSGTPFSIIMVDIDFFKKFNDKYGHSIGDEVLKLIGAIIRNNLKGKDFPARYGGEEFIIILAGTSLENSYAVAEDIRKRIAENRVKIVKTGESLDQITVSMGIAAVNSKDSIMTLLDRVDAALYLAKKMGRNNVKTEEDLDCD